MAQFNVFHVMPHVLKLASSTGLEAVTSASLDIRGITNLAVTMLMSVRPSTRVHVQRILSASTLMAPILVIVSDVVVP